MRKLAIFLQVLSPVFDADLDYDEQDSSRIISNRLLSNRKGLDADGILKQAIV